MPMTCKVRYRFVRAGSTTLCKMEIRPLPFETLAFDVSLAWRAGDDRNPRISAFSDAVFAAAQALEKDPAH